MRILHLYAAMLILALSSLAVAADQSADNNYHCPRHVNDCQLHPCPCQPGESTLDVFPDSASGQTLCVCSSEANSRFNLRRRAADSCHRHQIEQRESCFVSHGDCPEGFAPIAYYADQNGDGFSACRDLRHHRAESEYNEWSQGPQTAHAKIIQQYGQLSEQLKLQGQGSPQPLPSQSIEKLSRYFRNSALHSLRFIQSLALSKGCFSDCEQIYCADPANIEAWTRTEEPIIDTQLLHQIAHAERCQIHGGRDRFASLWYRYLPAQTQQQLNKGEAIDADNIHFAMYMEQQAEHQAETICRRLADCSKVKKH